MVQDGDHRWDRETTLSTVSKVSELSVLCHVSLQSNVVT